MNFFFSSHSFKWLPLVMVLMSLASCSSKYKIEGTSSVTGLDGKMLYLRSLKGGEWVNVDSAEVVHGLFEMKGVADSARMVTIYMDEEGLMPIVLENGTIKVTIANNELKASGTTLNDCLYAFIDKRNDYETRLGELDSREARMVLDGVNVDEAHAQVAEEGNKLVKEMHEYVIGFIKENYGNVLGASVFMMMCSTLPYPMMTPEIEDVMRTAPASFKDDEMVQEFLSKAKENMKLIEEHQRLEENKIVSARENKSASAQ